MDFRTLVLGGGKGCVCWIVCSDSFGRTRCSALHARPEALQKTAVQAQPSLSSPCLVSPLEAFCHLPLLLPWILQIDRGSEWRRGTYSQHTPSTTTAPCSHTVAQFSRLPSCLLPIPILLPAPSPQYPAHYLTQLTSQSTVPNTTQICYA